MNFHACYVLLQMIMLLMLSVAMHPQARPKVQKALITGLSFMGGYTQALTEQAGFTPNTDTQDLPANAAIAIQPGLVLLSKGSAGAYTLALPTAGAQSEGGQDGIEMEILSTTAFAHVVTTPALGFNNADDTATYGAAVGNSIRIIANGGFWIVKSLNGVTLTEV